MSRITAVPHQDEISVFVNEQGDICLEQQNALEPSALIWVAPGHVERVIKALRTAKRQAQGAAPT